MSAWRDKLMVCPSCKAESKLEEISLNEEAQFACPVCKTAYVISAQMKNPVQGGEGGATPPSPEPPKNVPPPPEPTPEPGPPPGEGGAVSGTAGESIELCRQWARNTKNQTPANLNRATLFHPVVVEEWKKIGLAVNEGAVVLICPECKTDWPSAKMESCPKCGSAKSEVSEETVRERTGRLMAMLVNDGQSTEGMVDMLLGEKKDKKDKEDKKNKKGKLFAKKQCKGRRCESLNESLPDDEALAFIADGLLEYIRECKENSSSIANWTDFASQSGLQSSIAKTALSYALTRLENYFHNLSGFGERKGRETLGWGED